MSKDELKGFWSFKEFSEWAFKNGELPYNQMDLLAAYEKAKNNPWHYLYQKKETMIITSTPRKDSLFFNMFDEKNFMSDK